MVDEKVKLFSEGLARTLNRRKFLKRAGQSTFFGLAALAGGHAVAGKAFAGEFTPPQCAPPGPYCNVNGTPLDGCNGASCFRHRHNGQVLQCRYWYIYQAGCWTTYVGNDYWVCCDCECGGPPRVTSCGCAQFSRSPVPRPDVPIQGGADS